MINLKIHQQKVYDCLQFVNKEAGKIGKNVKRELKEKLMDLIISDAAKKYGLKFANVKIIFYGKISYNGNNTNK